MKFKSKAWIGVLVFLTIGWPVLAPDYTPTQAILATVFAYLAVRLFGVVLSSGSGKDIYSQLDEEEDSGEPL